MALVDNINDVAFASAFEVDKLFTTKYSGSFSVGPSTSPPFFGTVATHSIAHAEGVNVLPVMIFSIDNTNWYDAGSMIFSAGGVTLDTDFSAICYTTATSLVIVGQNFAGSTRTCYYKAALVSDD